jgi:hypothetical protein
MLIYIVYVTNWAYMIAKYTLPFILLPSMPKQFISLPIVYIIVGLYRTARDPNIRVPIWVRADAPYSMKPVMAVAGQTPTWIDARTCGRINICKSFTPLCTHLFDVVYPCPRPH